MADEQERPKRWVLLDEGNSILAEYDTEEDARWDLKALRRRNPRSRAISSFRVVRRLGTRPEFVYPLPDGQNIEEGEGEGVAGKPSPEAET